jgi:DNA polymerase III alpha subunit
VREPAVSLRPMTSRGEVVEEYRHVGLTLRQHPASFLRTDLASRRTVTCVDAMNARDGKWLTTAGLVLVRQKPGSAKGVMFITIEDETLANLVIWPSLYERQRRIILSAGMIAVQGTRTARGRGRACRRQPSDRSICGLGRASASATTVSRCRTAAAMNSITAVRASIRAACRRSPATSTCRTFTLTRSK